MALPATDSFTNNSGSTQGLATYSSNWTIERGRFDISDANDYASGTLTDDNNIARWNADVPNADQYSQVAVRLGGGYFVGAAVRVQAGAATCYAAFTDGTVYYVSRFNANAETVLVGPTSQAWSTGDVLRLEVSGTGATVTLKLFRNGTQLGSDISDSSAGRITSANYLGIYAYSNAALAAGVDTWEGGNLGASASIVLAAARFRADDGSESGASWLAAQNVSIYRAADLATRIRMLLQATGNPATQQWQLEYRLSGGSWAAVPGAPTAASVTFGAIGTGAGGTTSCAPTYPTGISSATSELLCFVTGRSNTADTAPTMPAGWTKIADLEGGTGTWGVDTGTRRAAIFRKDTVTGSETGTVTVSLAGSTANTLYASIVRFERPAGHTLDVAVATAQDTSNDTSLSLAASSSLSWAASDLLAYCIAQNIDTGTHSSQSITASGVTFGTRTNHRSQAVTNGNDHRHLVESVPVTTGSGSSAPTYSATLSASGSGPAAFVRLRSIAPTQSIRLKASSNIAAAAADTTTQQLTGGTGTFLAGRISDDTNPLPTLDLGADGFTELEWCVEANSAGVTAGQVYEFRVTAAGAALNGYTVTPTITIGSEPAFAWAALVRRAPTLFRRH